MDLIDVSERRRKATALMEVEESESEVSEQRTAGGCDKTASLHDHL